MKTSKFEKLILELYYQGMRDVLAGKDNIEVLTKAYEAGIARAFTNFDEDEQGYTEEEIIAKILLKE